VLPSQLTSALSPRALRSSAAGARLEAGKGQALPVAVMFGHTSKKGDDTIVSRIGDINEQLAQLDTIICRKNRRLR